LGTEPKDSVIVGISFRLPMRGGERLLHLAHLGASAKQEHDKEKQLAMIAP
jgi:hypothetical protein